MPAVTQATIAAAAGVSKNAVSLALRGDPQISADTRRRIERIARKLGYVRNPVMAELMAELRRRQPPGYRRTLALFNANQDETAFRKHPTLPNYIAGCRRRAEAQGYRLDEFWLQDPALTPARAERILTARGIRGILIVGLMKENRLPPAYEALWGKFACVVTGVRTRQPTLPFCSVDHHALVLQAMEQCLALGYQRPALAVDRRIDHLVEGRFTAGMHYAQRHLAPRDRIPPFDQIEEARADSRVFNDWIQKYRPDVILTLYNVVRDWSEALGYRVPDDLGLVQLELRKGNQEWSGMDQHNDITGEAAVDMLIGMMHNQETGLQPHQRATLINGSWVPGSTTRPQTAVLHA